MKNGPNALSSRLHRHSKMQVAHFRTRIEAVAPCIPKHHPSGVSIYSTQQCLNNMPVNSKNYQTKGSLSTELHSSSKKLKVSNCANQYVAVSKQENTSPVQMKIFIPQVPNFLGKQCQMDIVNFLRPPILISVHFFKFQIYNLGLL